MAVLATEGPGAGAYHSKEESKDRTRKYETGRDEAGAFLYPPRRPVVPASRIRLTGTRRTGLRCRMSCMYMLACIPYVGGR